MNRLYIFLNIKPMLTSIKVRNIFCFFLYESVVSSALKYTYKYTVKKFCLYAICQMKTKNASLLYWVL